MTIDEFSNSFDTLLNSYALISNFGEETSKQTITLDEYEKSVLLTKAQEEIVLSLYNSKNPYGEAFEGTEELRRYLSNLITEKSLKPITNISGTPLGLESKSKFFTLPEDLWFITLESVVIDNSKCDAETIMKVYPVKQDEYQAIRDNPFRGANDRRALRLDLSEGNVEIICKYMIAIYYIRYIKKVPPIILEDLPNDLTIEGKSEASDCILHEALHQKILDRAVQLALQSRGYNINK
ncbi:hypothetical protein [Prevotella sp.]|nr:hypothetical protein [Prevotella sp.]